MSNDNVAVVFAYHNVGVRSIAALLQCGVNIELIVTHEDKQDENIWFESVEHLAKLNDIPVIKPIDTNSNEMIDLVKSYQPNWIFSFYYRHMLSKDLLSIPKFGAFNLHGSLLPKYRGRVPINWAIIHGETETGASLHRMVAKPDAGALVDQIQVPILLNDTADQVFTKVTNAAEILLLRTIPQLLKHQIDERPMDLAAGSYFGGRQPKDGLINWELPAIDLHNFIRALAPPYPGAFFETPGGRLMVMGSYFRGLSCLSQEKNRWPLMYWKDGKCWVDCIDGKRCCIIRLCDEEGTITESKFNEKHGSQLELLH